MLAVSLSSLCIDLSSESVSSPAAKFAKRLVYIYVHVLTLVGIGLFNNRTQLWSIQ